MGIICGLYPHMRPVFFLNAYMQPFTIHLIRGHSKLASMIKETCIAKFINVLAMHIPFSTPALEGVEA